MEGSVYYSRLNLETSRSMANTLGPVMPVSLRIYIDRMVFIEMPINGTSTSVVVVLIPYHKARKKSVELYR